MKHCKNVLVTFRTDLWKPGLSTHYMRDSQKREEGYSSAFFQDITKDIKRSPITFSALGNCIA